MEIQKIQLDNTPPTPQIQVNNPSQTKKLVILALVAGIILGGTSGFIKAKIFSSSSSSQKTKTVIRPTSESELKVGAVYGSKDEQTFRDTAEGVLQKGGIDGEGSHHLVRPGGPSQNVYLTSSVVDLDMFVGYKVKVWGETFAAKKAGWLMDVGRVEILGKSSNEQ